MDRYLRKDLPAHSDQQGAAHTDGRRSQRGKERTGKEQGRTHLEGVGWRRRRVAWQVLGKGLGTQLQCPRVPQKRKLGLQSPGENKT